MQNYSSHFQIQREITKSEYQRIKLFIAALIASLILMSVMLFFLSNVAGFFKFTSTPKFIILWNISFLLYEILMLFIARFNIKRQETQSGVFKIINVSIEALFPGFLLFKLCQMEASPTFLDSPLFLFYFVIIVLSVLHLNVKLVLITTIITSLSYLILTIWAVDTFDPEYNTMHLHPFLYSGRSVFIFISGLSAVFVSFEMKKRIVHIIKLAREKKEIEGLFSQQVSPQVVEALVKDQNRTHKTIVSILFLDIRNFSTFAEMNEPQAVNDFQNDLFRPLIEIVNQNKGIVNQILGDGFMATFGAPIEDHEHEQNAVKSGLEILLEIESLIEKKIIPKTRVGIGVHSGQVVIGNIGNEIRKQYSVSGTAVIIAARLEQLNKELNSTFLISKDVYKKVKSLNLKFSTFKEIKLKGIEKTIEVYSVLINYKQDK